MQGQSVSPTVWRAVGRFFRVVLLVVLIVCALTGLSFLVARPFTIRGYSDRLFWGGIGTMMIGFVGVLASLGSYQTLGTPSPITAPGDARIAHSRVEEHMRMNAARYGFIIRMVLSGVICIGLSALIEVLTR